MYKLLSRELQAGEKPVVVVGLGDTGLSCARLLHRQGIVFSVMDNRDLPPGLAQLRAEMPEVETFLGKFDVDVLLAAQRLLVSPGVSLEEPELLQAGAAGIEIAGDMDLFCELAEAPVVAITGSNAKSTVTDLLGVMAQASGRSVGVGGNLGIPALELLNPETDLYVIEMSSFQLERAGALNIDLAVLLNLSDDHIDRHGNLENYRSAKQRVFYGASRAVINRDDDNSCPANGDIEVVSSFGLDAPEPGQFGLLEDNGELWLARGSECLIAVDELQLLGRHNYSNALACLALGTELGLNQTVMFQTLREYQGLPHRCELVADIDGVRYVNDSKATNTGAAIAALEGLGQSRNILLIAGGQGKGADFSILHKAVAEFCKAVFLLGEDAAVLESALDGAAPLHRVGTLSDAVSQVAAVAVSGDVVLLSPACASFDMFESFEHRGDCYRDAVLAQPVGGVH